MSFIALHQPHPYHRVFGDDDTVRQQQLLHQLQQMGVDSLEAHGEVQHKGCSVLGVGYCGIVVSGRWQGRVAAIKVRRNSCRQVNLDNEARLLQQANGLGLGPKLYCAQGDIIVMQRLMGQPFGQWLEQLHGNQIPQLKTILRCLLWQGFQLDQAGIDHGALRCVSEHAFIEDDQLTLIDFSHSSDQRHPNNVTSLVSGLLWGTKLAQFIPQWLTVPQRDELLPALRQYKQQPTQEHFELLLGQIGLPLCEK